MFNIIVSPSILVSQFHPIHILLYLGFVPIHFWLYSFFSNWIIFQTSWDIITENAHFAPYESVSVHQTKHRQSKQPTPGVRGVHVPQQYTGHPAALGEGRHIVQKER